MSTPYDTMPLAELGKILHEHSGLALRLVLTGMEIQTRTMLDLVRVVGQAG